METAALEVQRLAALANARLARAQRAEVLHRLGHRLAVQVHHNAARRHAVNLNVKEHLVRHRRLWHESAPRIALHGIAASHQTHTRQHRVLLLIIIIHANYLGLASSHLALPRRAPHLAKRTPFFVLANVAVATSATTAQSARAAKFIPAGRECAGGTRRLQTWHSKARFFRTFMAEACPVAKSAWLPPARADDCQTRRGFSPHRAEGCAGPTARGMPARQRQARRCGTRSVHDATTAIFAEPVDRSSFANTITGDYVPAGSIPATGRGNSEDGAAWLNPSASQLFRAMKRRDKGIDEADAPAVARVHEM